MGKIFTDEEIEFAKNISLTKLASRLGYTVTKKGNLFSLKEMDSIRIHNDRTWYRWSGKGSRNGGSTIDFVMEFGNVISSSNENELVSAVKFLLDFGGYRSYTYDEIKKINYEKKQQAEYRSADEDGKRKEMILPEKNGSGYKRAYAYLIKGRGLSADTVNFFVKKHLLYEDAEHHNIVFLGYDKDGGIRFATKRGTSDLNGYRYRGDVPGNDKNYGVNIANKKSDTLNVFEASIDMMSFCEIFHDKDKTNKLALSMLSDAPIETFIKENPQIKSINFWLDNDAPGRKAAEKLCGKYKELGFKVCDKIVPEGKDLNEYLQILNERSMQRVRKI